MDHIGTVRPLKLILDEIFSHLYPFEIPVELRKVTELIPRMEY